VADEFRGRGIAMDGLPDLNGTEYAAF